MSRLIGLALTLALTAPFLASATAAEKARSEVRAISSAAVTGESVRGNGN